MADFIKLYDLWTADGALEIDVLEATDTTFNFDVVRCKYAETYREMGLGKIGHLMSCNRDGTFCEGYDPNIKLERQHTIMAGVAALHVPVFLPENGLIEPSPARRTRDRPYVRCVPPGSSHGQGTSMI